MKLLLLIGVFAGLSSFAAFENPEFPVTTFDDFERLPGTQEVKAADGDYNMDMHRPGLQVSLAYTGQERPISKERRKLIDLIANSLGNYGFSNAFIKEIKVTERGQEHWVAIQKDHAPHLPKELKLASQFKAQLRLLGSYRHDLVYVMISYVALK